jgi:hypothetical protein
LYFIPFTSLPAQVTVSPTYPNINTFLWGNTSVNAVGQTSYVTGTGYGYRYLLPLNYNPALKYPAIIFLHGDGESGTDNVLQLSVQYNTGNGVLALVSTANPNNQQNYPCFFICPQKPIGSIWSSAASATAIQNLLTIFETQYPNSFDKTRIYITGLSDGGTGAYDMPYLLAQSTNLGANPFAATVPMSASFGYYIDRPFSSQPFMPIWTFHAANDPTAPIAGSDDTCVPAFRALGYSVVYSRYLTGMHAIWELAYQQPQLLPWLFSQQLGQAVQAPLSNFAVTTATQSSGPVLNLTGTTSSAEGFTGLTWSNTTNSQSGTDSAAITPTWSISSIPLAVGTNDIQVTASAPNNTALVLGTPANYGGTLTVNLPLDVSPSINVALNQPVTVSSVTSSLGGANAVDGNPLTRWSSAYSDPQWIEVDLGTYYAISEVDLTWETACGKNYQIQTSPDGVVWTAQTSVTGNTTTGLLAYTYSNPPVARFVRMYGTARATTWGYSLYEFAVYSNGIPQPAPTNVVSNIALGKPVTVSSSDSTGNAAANAVDGNPLTRWSSAYSDPQWIVVDLGADYQISEIDLNWETACGANYLIQTSTDDINWTTQNNVTGNTTTGLIQYPYSTPIYGRYVRMYGTARATTWGYSLWELAVYSNGTTVTTPPPTPPPTSNVVNVALNKTVVVSSTDATANAGANAVDGSLTTRWSSAYSDPQWIEIDLGAYYAISEIDLDWETACGANYLLQTSNDGIAWTTQTTVTGNTTAGLLQYPYTNPPTARYVRMYGTARATSWGYSLWEFSVYSNGTQLTPPTTTTTNLALNMPVTVSSTDSPGNAGANAVDGNPLTRWSSAYSDPQWIVVDLGATHTINEIDLDWETACGMNYQIQTSPDDVNWTTQTNVTGNTSTGLLQYPYSTPISARYVRMYGTARATVWGYSLYEFSVYGQ